MTAPAKNPQPRKCVMVYALDADRARTASLGIYNYTRLLLRAIARQNDPGFDFVVLVSQENEREVLPHDAPIWMRVASVRGRFGAGLKRLWADHVLSIRYARRLGAQIVLFPKGWLPMFPARNISIMATMHDTMNSYYRTHYPEYLSSVQTSYWIWNMRRIVARADVITTISNFSRDEVLKLGVQPRSEVHVIHPGPGVESRGLTEPKVREGILVIGSRHPHKATRKTLALLEAYSRDVQSDIPVYVAGLREWPAEWGAPPPAHQTTFLGRISDSELCQWYSAVEAFVFLSEMEGFGMPLLEALGHGAPVCYLAAHAVREVFGEGQEQCGWDGGSDRTFFAALDHVREMSADEVQQWHTRVHNKANWSLCAERHLALIGEHLGLVPHGGHGHV